MTRDIELSAGTIEYEDSYTLIPLDQPARLAQVIRDFTREADGSAQ